MKKLPKISIVIPSYNKVDYIEETLKSVVSQDYPDLEVIIQDGGSTDGTLEIIKKYAKKYPKIIRWVSKKDKGQTDAINKGLSKETGEILGFINADDLYRKGALLKVAKAYTNKPSSLWIAGRGDIIDASGNRIASLVTIYKNLLLSINKPAVLLLVNYLTQPSVFLSKQGFNKLGSFKSFGKGVLEYEAWLKLAFIEMPLILKDNLSSFRIIENSFSAKLYTKTMKSEERVLREYTSNAFILLLHRLHNYARLIILKFVL